MFLELREKALLVVITGYYLISYLTGNGLSGGSIHGVLPNLFAFLTDCLLLGYFVLVVGERILKRQAILSWRPLNHVLLALLTVTLISALINVRFKPSVLMLGFRASLEYTVCYYLVMNATADVYWLRKISKLLLAIAWLQLPVSVIYYVFVAAPAGDRDMVVGTMSGVSAAYLLTVAGSVALASAFLNRNNWYAKAIVALLATGTAALGGEALAFALQVIAFLFVCLLSLRRAPTRVFMVLGLIIISSLIIILYNPILDAEQCGRKDLMGIQGYFRGMSELIDNQASWQGKDDAGRIVKMAFALNYLDHQGLTAQLFGTGPGATIRGTRTGVSGDFEVANPSLQMAYLDLTRFYLETGILSVILVITALLMIGCVGFRLFRYDKDSYFQALGVGGAVAALWFIMYLPYTSLWSSGPSSVFFWSLAGCLSRRARSINIL